MNYNKVIITICNNKNKVYSVQFFIFITLNFAIVSIFPEIVIALEFFSRILFFFIIPIGSLIFLSFFIKYFINLICYKIIIGNIKLNSKIDDQCYLYAGELKKRNIKEIIKDLRSYLLLENYENLLRDFEDELDYILKYIKKLALE